MTLTSGQLDATQRRTLRGVVYALSGTLNSRVPGIPDAELRWASQSVPSGSGPIAGTEFEPYLVPPDAITRELSFRPDEPTPLRPINLTMRNLPFRHKEGLLAAVVDEDWAWEGAEASLWVAYLKPGQTISDLSTSDWVAERLRGTFGAPRDMRPDGMTVPLHSRDVLRRQRQLTTVATSGQFPNIDPTDEGKVIPIIVGEPGSMWRTLRVNAGMYGLAKGWSAGATSIQVNTPFSRSQWQARVAAGAEFYIAKEEETRTLSVISGQEGSQVLVLGLTSAMDFSAADGALIQEKLTGDVYEFLMARTISDAAADETYSKAFIGLDGRLIPIAVDEVTDIITSDGALLRLNRVPAIRPNEAVSGGVTVTKEEVTQQPSFSTTATQTLSSKLNYPTGSTGSIGVNHALARDGNENTGASLSPTELLTLTFNSAPSPFEDDDTTASTLHVICQGKITFRNPTGTVTYATTNVIGKAQFRFTQVSPRDYDAAITCVADSDGGGAVIYEAWWEHDLSEPVEIDQDQDVQIDVDIDSNFPSADTLAPIAGIAVKPRSNQMLDSPWCSTWPLPPTYTENPATIFAATQALLVEGEASTGSANWNAYINSGAYDVAKARFEALGISGQGFVLTKPITWSELEAQLAAQSRCHAFYGPSGHELVVMESADTLEATAVEMEFRLPGTPNPNAAQATGAPLMERGNTADVVNTVLVHWDREWLLDTSTDPGQLYRRQVSGVDTDSVSVYGERIRPEGAMAFWSWGVGNGSSFGREMVSGIAQFYADRFAFGVTRFTFETGHHAARLTRADIVRVAFAAAPNVYRNVPCVVEAIRRSPLDGERYTVTVRAIGIPQKGLTYALTWEDLFVGAADKWHTRITGRLDRWGQYWAVPEE